MIAAVVAVRELDRPTAQGQPEELTPEADAEHRDLADEPLDEARGAGHGRRVARTIRQDDAGVAVGEDLAGRHRRRQDANPQALGDEPPENGPLDTEIDDRDGRSVVAGVGVHRVRGRPPRPLVPRVGLAAGHLAGEIAAVGPPGRAGTFGECFGRGSVGRQHSRNRSGGADMADDGSDVESPADRDAESGEPLVRPFLRSPRGGLEIEILDDERPCPDPIGLGVEGVDPDLTHVRRRQTENLTVVRRVGEHLLIPRHRGVEDDLAVDDGTRTGGEPGKDRSIAEDEVGGPRAVEQAGELQSCHHPEAGG